MDEQLMQVSCSPVCGFKVQSHNKDELRKIVTEHSMSQHQKDVKPEEVDTMMMMVVA
jgi:predicted small metal-binding protein